MVLSSENYIPEGYCRQSPGPAIPNVIPDRHQFVPQLYHVSRYEHFPERFPGFPVPEYESGHAERKIPGHTVAVSPVEIGNIHPVPAIIQNIRQRYAFPF